MPTPLKQPVTRRINQRLVVTITSEGVELRGYRCRNKHIVTWAQIASLADANLPVLVEEETRRGEALLNVILPADNPEQPSADAMNGRD